MVSSSYGKCIRNDPTNVITKILQQTGTHLFLGRPRSYQGQISTGTHTFSPQSLLAASDSQLSASAYRLADCRSSSHSLTPIRANDITNSDLFHAFDLTQRKYVFSLIFKIYFILELVSLFIRILI